MTTVTKQATSDLSNTGGFTTSPLFSKINDSNDATLIIGVTAGGGRATFGFTAFSLPAEAVISSVDIHYRHRSTTTSAAYAHGACIKVGAVYYGRGQTAGWDAGQATGVASGSAIADRVYSGTLNPAAGAAWTVTAVNALTEFGICSDDFTPDANFYQVDITVNYTILYNETNKAQVVLAAQAKTDILAASEVSKSQILLAVQSKTDIQVASEVAKQQVVLTVQAETDGFFFDESGKSQVIIAAQSESDIQGMNEDAKGQTILAVQNNNDVFQISELSKSQIITAIQGKTDTAVMSDYLSQLIVVVQIETDVLVPASGGGHLYRRNWPSGNRLIEWGFNGRSQI